MTHNSLVLGIPGCGQPSPRYHYFTVDHIQLPPSPVSFSLLCRSRFLETLPGDFYVRQLGLICKTEWKMDKITPIPFRFRIGSLEQVNWLEGKRVK